MWVFYSYKGIINSLSMALSLWYFVVFFSLGFILLSSHCCFVPVGTHGAPRGRLAWTHALLRSLSLSVCIHATDSRDHRCRRPLFSIRSSIRLFLSLVQGGMRLSVMCSIAFFHRSPPMAPPW